MKHVSPVLMRKLQMTCPRIWHVCFRARTRFWHVTTYLIQSLIIPGTLEIQISGNNLWVQYVLPLLPLFEASPELPITGESDSGFFPHTKYVVSLPTATNYPNTHWVFSKSIYFWWESMELLQILKVEGSRPSSVQMAAMRSWVNHAWNQITKMGDRQVYDPNFKIQQLSRTGGWTSGNHCLLFPD